MADIGSRCNVELVRGLGRARCVCRTPARVGTIRAGADATPARRPRFVCIGTEGPDLRCSGSKLACRAELRRVAPRRRTRSQLLPAAASPLPRGRDDPRPGLRGATPGTSRRKTGRSTAGSTPRAARSAERVICVSQFTADDVCARYGVDAAKVRVVPNAPSLPIGDLPAPHGDPYLLASATCAPRRTSSGWSRPGARCAPAGRRAPARARRPGRRCAVARGRRASPASWPTPSSTRCCAAPTLLVHPSLYEGFGLVVAEAMARGVPVACADATALPETAGGAAELFDPHDSRRHRRRDPARAGRAATSWRPPAAPAPPAVVGAHRRGDRRRLPRARRMSDDDPDADRRRGAAARALAAGGARRSRARASIVVDNACSDRTVSRVPRSSARGLVRLRERVSYAAAINAALGPDRRRRRGAAAQRRLRARRRASSPAARDQLERPRRRLGRAAS